MLVLVVAGLAVAAAAPSRRFAADGSIVHVEPFYVDALCGDDRADGRSANSALATLAAGLAAARASGAAAPAVHLRAGQAHPLADGGADGGTIDVLPWRPELGGAATDERGCPFQREIYVGLAPAPGSEAAGEVQLAGWDLQRGGGSSRLLLYLLLFEVPPTVAHTVVVSAKGLAPDGKYDVELRGVGAVAPLQVSGAALEEGQSVTLPTPADARAAEG